MATRTFEVLDFAEEGYTVALADKRVVAASTVDDIVDWIEEHLEGKYLVLINSVWFNSDRDALIFKMGYVKLS